MIINDEKFRDEFDVDGYLDAEREHFPEHFDEKGRRMCDLSDGDCPPAVVAIPWAPQHLLFLCRCCACGFHAYAKELAADAEWIDKNTPRDEYGFFLDEEERITNEASAGGVS